MGYSPWGCNELDTTERLHFHALEKEMATYSSVLAWRIPGMGEPGGLLPMGLYRVGHDWSDLAIAAAASHSSSKFTSSIRTSFQVSLPCSGHDCTLCYSREVCAPWLQTGWCVWLVLVHIKGFPDSSVVKNLPANSGDSGLIPGSGESPGEGNDNPLWYSCLGNPMDRGAWWAPGHGVAKSWTRPSSWAHRHSAL